MHLKITELCLAAVLYLQSLFSVADSQRSLVRPTAVFNSQKMDISSWHLRSKVILQRPTLAACAHSCANRGEDCWAFMYLSESKTCQLIVKSQGRLQNLWFWREDSGENFILAHISNSMGAAGKADISCINNITQYSVLSSSLHQKNLWKESISRQVIGLLTACRVLNRGLDSAYALKSGVVQVENCQTSAPERGSPLTC